MISLGVTGIKILKYQNLANLEGVLISTGFELAS